MRASVSLSAQYPPVEAFSHQVFPHWLLTFGLEGTGSL